MEYNKEEQISKAYHEYDLKKNISKPWYAFKAGVEWADSCHKENGIEMWLSRHKNGRHLRLHFDKPIMGNKFFYDSKPLPEEDQIYLPEDMFPEIIFENSPQKVRLTLIKE